MVVLDYKPKTSGSGNAKKGVFLGTRQTQKIILRTALILFSLFAPCFAPRVNAYTEADYYNTGLGYFTAKNYSRAAQYFSQVLSLDPHNSPALRGRADCYYELGRFSEALRDYKEEMALKPSDQTVLELSPPDELSERIQELQTRVNLSTPTPEAFASPAKTDPFSRGIVFYLQKNYASSLPCFQQALRDDPSNPRIYNYLGATELKLMDNKNAVLDLIHSLKLQTNPLLNDYVNRLKNELSPEEQRWVEAQLAPSQNLVQKTPPKRRCFGIRLVSSITLPGLKSFDTNAQALRSNITQIQSSDPSLSYQGTVPHTTLDAGVEPALRIGSHFEIGLPMSYVPFGTVHNSISDSNGNRYADSYGLSAWTVGLNAQYSIGSGSFRPFLSLGGFLTFMKVDYSNSYDFTNLSAGTVSGSLSGVGVGGQTQLGADWRLGKTFVVSPFVGYQRVEVQSLKGSLNDGSAAISSRLETVPTAGGKTIAPVSNGTLTVPVFTDAGVLLPGAVVPTGAQALGIDLSGFKTGLQVSAFF